MDKFFEAVNAAKTEYYEYVVSIVCSHRVYRFYKPDLEKRIAERKAAEERRKKAQLDKLKKDISKTHGGTVVLDAKPPAPKTLDDIDAEEEDAEEEFDAAYDEEEEGSILSYCCC
jgi:hypothetical protein